MKGGEPRAKKVRIIIANNIEVPFILKTPTMKYIIMLPFNTFLQISHISFTHKTGFDRQVFKFQCNFTYKQWDQPIK